MWGYGPCDHPLQARDLELEQGQPVLTCVRCYRQWHLSERITTEQAVALARQIEKLRLDAAEALALGATGELPDGQGVAWSAESGTTPGQRWTPGDRVTARREAAGPACVPPEGVDGKHGAAGDDR
jgi:hypothetical protein